jgi:hypothetical protein
LRGGLKKQIDVWNVMSLGKGQGDGAIAGGRDFDFVSIAARYVPVIAALVCTTKRSVEGVKILD